MMNSMITVKSSDVWYLNAGVPAVVLREVDLRLFDGYNSLAIFGANGAGKSTLLKGLFTEDVHLNEGSVVFHTAQNKTMTKEDVIDQRLSNIIFSEPRYPDISVKQLMGLYGTLDQRITQEGFMYYLEVLGETRSFLDLSFSKLSAGQKKKLHISLALLRWTKYNILDEIVANLDCEAVGNCRRLLLEKLEDGVSNLIFISHSCAQCLFLEYWLFFIKDTVTNSVEFLVLKLSELRQLRFYSLTDTTIPPELTGDEYTHLDDGWILSRREYNLGGFVPRDNTEGLIKLVEYYYATKKMPDLVKMLSHTRVSEAKPEFSTATLSP